MTADELKDAIVRSLIYNRLTYEGRLLYEEKRGLSDGYPAHHHSGISAAESHRPGLITAGLLSIPWRWWVIFDRNVADLPARPPDLPLGYWDYGQESDSVGGYSLRNECLEKIDSGWIYFLDDDNLIHPHLEIVFLLARRSFPAAQWFIFRQVRPDGTIYLRPQVPPRVNAVDIGQCVLRRDLMKNTGEPIPPWSFEHHPAADGLLYERLSQDVAPIALDLEATYYNALR